MANIKFYYFKGSGRGEVCRLLLAASGVEWEDIRFTGEEWPKYKPESPFGQAPFMDYKGTKCGQSVAIANFLAREFGFYGKNNLEALRIDEVTQLTQDLFSCLIKVYFEKDEAKKAELMEKAKKEDIPKFYGTFQRLLKESGTGFLVGKQISMADVYVYDAVVNAVGENLKLTDAANDFPEVKAVCDKVAANPNIKKYLDKQKAATK